MFLSYLVFVVFVGISLFLTSASFHMIGGFWLTSLISGSYKDNAGLAVIATVLSVLTGFSWYFTVQLFPN